MKYSINKKRFFSTGAFYSASLRCGIKFCLLLGLIFGSLQFAKAQEIGVTTCTVTTNMDSGVGSLRDAITNCVNTAATQIVTVNFSPAVTSIALLSPLPAITHNSTTIDGTQSGGAAPTVELNGTGAGGSAIGLRISASSCTIRGLIVNRFQEAGIRIDTGTGNSVLGNYIGTDTTGNSTTCGSSGCGNFNRGILIAGSTGNVIGDGTGAGRNVISGNFGTGVSITAGGSATIRGNLIGTDTTGSAMLSNSQEGIRIADSSGSTIGTGTGTDVNVISGNNSHGISIIQSDIGKTATGNVIVHNFIGVNATGNTALRNVGSGVVINAAGNTVGGTSAGAGNFLSGNGGNGVSLGSNFSTGNVVAGNFIGIGLDGTTSVPNRDNGVQVSNNAAGNTIGGTSVTPGNCSGACNVIANNGAADSTSARAGVYVDLTAGAGNAIRGNSIFNNGTPPNNSQVNGLGIDLGAVSSNANDTLDPDTGANDLQNYPVISSATTNGAIQGALNSTANSTFAIDFYSNLAADGAMSEGRTFIGSANVVTDSSGNATIAFNAPQGITLSAGQFITATATSLSGAVQAVGDTSEFSAAQGVTVNAQPLGYEGDVTPRSTGDGAVDATDVQQIRRFAVGLDKPYQLNEGQRADCAPRSTNGDGFVDAQDIAQARRYAVGLDPLTPASGTVMVSRPEPAGKSSSNAAEAPAAPRTLSVQSVSTSSGQQVTVNILVDAAGDENSYTFSISYDSTKLTLPSDPTQAQARISGNLANESILANPNTPGQIGFSVDFGSRTAPAGNGQVLVSITFDVAANAATGLTPINFTSTPARQSTTNTSAQPLATNYTNGTVNITAPTAAPATVGGHIRSATGTDLAGVSVTLLNLATGKSAETITDKQGVYRFEDVDTGDNYLITPRIFGYVFNPTNKYVSLVGDVTDADFNAIRNKKGRNTLRKF